MTARDDIGPAEGIGPVAGQDIRSTFAARGGNPPNEKRDAGWGELDPTAPDKTHLVTLASVLPALKRSAWLIAFVTFATTLLAAFYVLITPAGYVATTQIIIEPKKQQFMWAEPGLLDFTVNNAEVDSQVEVLRSDTIAAMVIKQLGLTKDPEFQVGGEHSDFERQRLAVAQFANSLYVRRISQSYVIEVSFRAKDPEKAARIANTIADAYIRDELHTKTDAARQAGEWMQDRITDLGTQLNSAARAVQQFKAANGIYDSNNTGQVILIDKLTELEARAEGYRKLYENFLEKFVENDQQQSFPVANARVISEATRPLAKSFPKTKLVMSLGLLMGLIAGSTIVFVRHIFDRTVRNASQIRGELGLSCIGTLPRYRNRTHQPPSTRRDEVIDAPFLPFAKSLRNVKVSLDVARRNRQLLRIGLLSVLPGEGKSTIAAGLGALFAQSGVKTLLIDCYFRDPALSLALAPTARAGLIDALHLQTEDIVLVDRKTKVHLLPAVNGQDLANSADILGSPAMEGLLARLSAQFGLILLDLPALTSGVDARAIGPTLDGCILVAEFGRVPLSDLRESIELLAADGISVLGVVINKIEEGVPPLFGITLDALRKIGRNNRGDQWAARVTQFASHLTSRFYSR